MTPDDEASLPKTLIARYRIEAQIGSGGMGVVYRATHTWTGRPVAIKVLHPLQPNSAAYRKRFMREARAAVSLRHPNVVDVLHMDQDERERVYLVMELLVGQPLSAALENRGPLSLAETCTRLLPIMDAVAHAHRAGIVHRDIKPDNIFLAETATGIVPKLLDFGVAKLVQEGGTTSITGSGQLVGTPRYMAPEQVAGTDAATPAVDVWALGMVAYECLWGHHPLGAAASLPALLLKVTRGEVPPLATRCPDLPAHAAAAIDRALQGDPRDRWPTVDALAGALSAAVGGDPDARFGPSAGARDRELTTGGAVRGDTAGLHQQAPATQARGRLKLVGAGLLALLAAIVWVLTERAAEDVRGFPPRLEVRVEEAPTASAQQAKVARGEGAREAPAYAREVPAASTAGSQVVSGVEARPPVGLPALRAAQVRR
ncbi:MAG: serine/threonine-protein kinase, partial [Myxococcales bacterium]|nr:serine/threonine-protein kinase [Myxococcales bacterium]